MIVHTHAMQFFAATDDTTHVLREHSQQQSLDGKRKSSAQQSIRKFFCPLNKQRPPDRFYKNLCRGKNVNLDNAESSLFFDSTHLPSISHESRIICGDKITAEECQNVLKPFPNAKTYKLMLQACES